MSPDQLQALRAEIAETVDPAVIAARDTPAIATAVSAGRTRTRVVPIADVQAYLQSHGIWWAIKSISRDTVHPAFAAAEAVMDVATARYENIDLGLPIVAMMFGGLVAAGVMTQDDMSALQALSVVDDPVSEFDVRRACWSDAGEWQLWH
jgi:hypothetical protein